MQSLFDAIAISEQLTEDIEEATAASQVVDLCVPQVLSNMPLDNKTQQATNITIESTFTSNTSEQIISNENKTVLKKKTHYHQRHVPIRLIKM